MLRSLYSGVSGIDANQEYIDSIGNDIANINTTGYKSNQVVFEDLLSQTIAGATAPGNGTGGVNPTQVGLGVKVAAVLANFTQGTTEQTGNPLDLAIQGNGFFVAKDGNQTYYTRAGSLQLDGNGNLVTPSGYLIQGWQANAQGAINTSGPLGPVSIPTSQQVAAVQTTSVTLGGNLAAQPGWTPPTGAPGSGSTSSTTPPVGASTSVTVYAANGTQQSLDLTFEQQTTLPSGAPKGAVTAWNVYGALTQPGASPDYTNSKPATLFFDSSGNLVGYTDTSGKTSTSTTGLNLSVPDETQGSASGSATASFTLDMPTVTANASQESVSPVNQNGNAPGSLQSYSIGSNGLIQGVFSNGQTLNLGQIALATFANPDGLLRAGDTSFTATANSGLAQVGPPNNGSRGSIQAGALEGSNVNLASEMTHMIEAERGFQANGSVITTSDALLQDIINLKPTP